MISSILSSCIRRAVRLRNNSVSFKAPTAKLVGNQNVTTTFAKHPIPVCNIVPLRCLHTKVPKTPDLIYVPHFFRWLKTKFRLKVLQKVWDPEFTEGSFIYGTSRAICRITEIIHENKPEELKGLLTTSAYIKLKDDIATKLSKAQKLIINIRPEDIKILVPMAVTLNRDGEQKHARIGMRILALKWIQQSNGALRLVLVALQTEFLRDYSRGALPDWIISSFDVLECTVLARA
ncbi:hypothetical protein NQ315_009330 [Exocentrus adspersus]|uniref:Uncharacterized protein n=1 Tax=Exocentrus adspersus TaxID=1586481 RepID=A0AAV8WH01_9CUCU|nr:hypothetical protein NQ315_009330 [Exocentrus adspersus]